ncbi:hypothetical protein [Candidatus Methanoprimaticola sp. MG2]|uniref:hypothetical protein n=1 Tax=Candidatus Methanoprimaticola sp. MG2 TaxID=3228838 RepID=UPI0039C6172B
MSFVDNQKLVGTAFTVIGILFIIAALVQLVGAFSEEGWTNIVGAVIAAIGAILAAILYFKYGNSVRKEELTGKLNILGSYVLVVGVTTVIVNIFAAIGGIIGEISFWDSLIMVILGIIVIWAGKKITDGKETTIDKILWIILTIVFLVLFVLNFVGIFGSFGSGEALTIIISFITSVCYAVVFLFMLLYMFDGEVKKGMGM